MSLPAFYVLDAFGCAGGSVAGWQQAGAHVVAVDTDEAALAQSTADEKIVGDAIAFVLEHGGDFDLRHGSPPCQRFTRGNVSTSRADKWPDLIGPWRDACKRVGGPYVIENVEQAAPCLRNPILLCGRMFDLGAVDTHPDAVGMSLVLERHRLFEFGGWSTLAPLHPVHTATTGIALVGEEVYDRATLAVMAKSGAGRYLTGRPHVAGAYGGARRDPWEAKYVRHGGYVPNDLNVIRDLLQTPHIKTSRYLFEAIPPAYTRWLGERFIEAA